MPKIHSPDQLIPNIVVITGPPGAGKTTLARKISEALSLPLLVKDDIKDVVFDGLGWSDREWSKRVGGTSFEVMYRLLEVQLASRVSVVVETAFVPNIDGPRLRELQKKFPFNPIQIVVTANFEVLFDRFSERATSGDRHPGHVDETVNRDSFLKRFSEMPYTALPIDGTVIEVDSTDFGRLDVDEIVGRLKSLICE